MRLGSPAEALKEEPTMNDTTRTIQVLDADALDREQLDKSRKRYVGPPAACRMLNESRRQIGLLIEKGKLHPMRLTGARNSHAYLWLDQVEGLFSPDDVAA